METGNRPGTSGDVPAGAVSNGHVTGGGGTPVEGDGERPGSGGGRPRGGRVDRPRHGGGDHRLPGLMLGYIRWSRPASSSILIRRVFSNPRMEFITAAAGTSTALRASF